MPRSVAAIAEEIAGILDPLRDDLQPVVERSINGLLSLKSSPDPFTSGRKRKRQVAECRAALATFRSQFAALADIAPLPGIVEPADLDMMAKIDKGLEFWFEGYAIPDPRVGVLQWYCATNAFGLMMQCSKSEPRGGPDSDYYEIASLLFEAITGKRQSVRRACEAVLQEWSPEVRAWRRHNTAGLRSR